MLAKLLKYDLAAVSRILVPVHAAAVLLALAAGGCFAGLAWMAGAAGSGSEASLAVVASVLSLTAVMCLVALVAAPVLTFAVIAWRFYRNLLTDEGYLSLTLPVGAGCHLASKLIVGVLWTAVDVVLVVACLLVACGGVVGYDVAMLRDALGPFLRVALGPDALLNVNCIAALCLSALAGQVVSVLIAYLAFLLGAIWASRHKAAAGVGLYLGLSWLYGLLTAIVSVALSITVFGSLDGAGSLLLWNLACAAGSLAVAAGLYALCAHLLGSRLDLA